MNEYRIENGKRILQCHSRGDKRFSPFFCTVKAFGIEHSIEHFYQCSKLFLIRDKWVAPFNWKEAKQLEKDKVTKHPRSFRLPDGSDAPLEFQVYGWYSSLWLKYLDAHPTLVAMASGYDDYEDIFKGDFPLCQADCIRLYCKQGRAALHETCREFLTWLRIRKRK